MDTSRDSSVWRSLAVAFGDGLAFGVGMKLTQNAPAKAALPAASPDLAGRLARVEQHLAQLERVPAPGSANLDPQVLEALTHALEARLQEIAVQTDRRLAELDVKVALELKGLRQQDHALASAAEDLQNRFDHRIIDLLQQASTDRAALQNQVVSLHREFASAVADIVEEQVATQVEQRLADAVRAQLAPLERQIDELRQRMTAADRNTLEIMLATSEAIRQAAARLTPAPAEPVAPAPQTPPPEPEAPPLARAATAANGAAPYKESDLPGFARVRKAATSISIPLVTSFVVTAGCVAILQYL
jgi:hypothetical protein